MAPLTIHTALRRALSSLSASDSAKIDAEVILAHCLGKSRTFLYTWPEYSLSPEQWQRFEQLLARRVAGEPIAHVIGEREFWSLSLMVNETTLIPRPDTEILVETALQLPLPASARVLDLGTGTGAIALALASEMPAWEITALDKVKAAVDLAKANRERLGLSHVHILQSDWFEALPGQRFDLIVSNPPYIAQDDHHLAEGDVRFEPRSALTAADEGFQDLEDIALHACSHLQPQGYLVMEHGFTQGARLRQHMTKLGYQLVTTVKDLGGNERCTLGCWQAS